ncbi:MULTISPECIES: MobV family relaxase [unclassified Lactococcus]|uniref:MobV family relaxase n=1 Tax=unclassified Lactococcus TaxID=2643510 RepID=UPI0011CC5F3F|nr:MULTISPECIES: MobV family relaxase [unclassified Lactococcus]MQW24098.1 hypothetical protein [Lactococcus sp. dk101]TXK33917.1 plasmid recombination protein [Lactococcus sp. dk310]TXK45699.1 plasmid recombination protein [Lactococcus sp. dk322]
MAYMVARTEKRKSGSLGGYQIHVDRKTDKHENQDIDNSKTYLNYDLVGHSDTVSFKKEFLDYIDENKASTRAVRKDAVVMQDWLIGSSQEFFNNLSEERTREYFQTAVDFFSEKFGRENIRFATVHMDEKTPHMHMGIVPMKDGRLTSKTIFDRNCLRMIQDELPKVFQNKGFDIERGIEKSEKKHLHPENYKNEVKKAQEDGEEKAKEIIEESLKGAENVKQELTEVLYKDWEDDWDETAMELKGFEFDDQYLYEGLECTERVRAIDEYARVDRDFPRKFAIAFQDVMKLIKAKAYQIQEYIASKWLELRSKESNLEKKEIQLTLREQWLESKIDTLSEKERKFDYKYGIQQHEIKKSNEHLADVAISLGIHDSWRDTMIKNGGQIGEFSDGRKIDKPFSELIPKLIDEASKKELESLIAKEKRRSYGGGGMSL